MNSLKNRVKLLIYSPHLRKIKQQFGNQPFRLLDVGCSNSVHLFKTMFPNVEYHGIDYQNPLVTETEKKKMSGYYEINLETLDFSGIPDGYFDAVVMSHVIEHLSNSEAVVDALLKKIAPGGYLFLEYPSFSATKIRSARNRRFVRGTANFYDDPTHVKLYDVNELSKIVRGHGFSVLKSGLRRNPYFLLFSPVLLPFRFISNGGYLKGSDLYDFNHFCTALYARRPD